jgi:hypothetical protein
VQRSLGTLLLVCTAISLAFCGTQLSSSTPQSALASARQQLIVDLVKCTQTFGYDPRNIVGVAENQLAPHELEWRQCGYDSLRKYAQNQPTLMGRYEQLINEDISMTQAIQSGTMTRSQRRQRIETLVAQIKDAEQQQVQAAATAQEQEMERVRRIVESMRGFD